MANLEDELQERLQEGFGKILDDYDEGFYDMLRERKKELKEHKKKLRRAKVNISLSEYDGICEELRKHNRAKMVSWIRNNYINQLVYVMAVVALIWLSIIANNLIVVSMCLVFIALLNVINYLALKGKIRKASRRTAKTNFAVGIVVSFVSIVIIVVF